MKGDPGDLCHPRPGGIPCRPCPALPCRALPCRAILMLGQAAPTRPILCRRKPNGQGGDRRRPLVFPTLGQRACDRSPPQRLLDQRAVGDPLAARRAPVQRALETLERQRIAGEVPALCARCLACVTVSGVERAENCRGAWPRRGATSMRSTACCTRSMATACGVSGTCRAPATASTSTVACLRQCRVMASAPAVVHHASTAACCSLPTSRTQVTVPSARTAMQAMLLALRYARTLGEGTAIMR
jgi:hypothetical protein